MTSASSGSTSVEHLLRHLAPQVLGSLAREFRDFGAAEEAVQDALFAASRQWPESGVPENPVGWLAYVARRRMIDHLRSERSRRQREEEVGAQAPRATTLEQEVRSTSDDTMLLLYMCCHPSLTTGSAIALTLRAVGGLTTAQIASAFLVPQSTIAQRISRAKQTISDSGVPFAPPDSAECARRLDSVLHVLYLIFNEGYTASSGENLHCPDLCIEAIRLTRQLHKLLPNDGEVEGLLALMLLTDARRPARTGAHGELIPIDEQDRSLWNRSMIDEGVVLVTSALPKGRVGEYQLLAAVAAVHADANSADETDWEEIASLYEVLGRISDNPLVQLNRAVAVSMVKGPEAGLELLRPLEQDKRLESGHRLDAVSAHLRERAGDLIGAEALYRKAAGKAGSIPERNYLLQRALAIGERSPARG